MSDDAAKHFEVEKPGEEMPQGGRSVTMTITLHPNGQMDFSLPTGNKILGYGMLECARAKLDELHLIESAKKAQASRGGVEGLLKRMNGR